jgi:hypothetical protein
LNHEPLFDERYLGDRTSPSEEAKIVEEEPEDVGNGKARDVGIVFESLVVIRGSCD